ncbi:serine/threonine-protein kinase [Streptomyces sp. JV176]|uniref:serine/threonine-protein kinase n=1 Tax=Streptomyces sp. JV176 TaxID=858630 RepID=UPI002E76183B|nr:serine/threonine-protein kinase [Streptomyces sp. JV176]MEE1797627.1 serine/threonine-protein kinase [Streptomyces sp. JV176]
MQPLDTGDPSAIGPYRLLGRLGAGGMGRVYLGRSAGGRTVAVKAVHPHFATDEEFRARFRREVDAARRVGTGPGGPRWSAPVLDADPEADVPWVVTGYVAGPSLTQAVAGHGPLPETSVRALGAGLAEALAAVHALGLIHRDVKPSNVLLALDGPRLIDFGIARATDGTTSLTSTGVSVGSPGYMAPEQILGRDVGGAADVFSMGAVLTYAITGASPFPGDSSAAAMLYKVVHEEPDLGALRGELREVVARCLAKDPAVRPAPAEVGRLLAPDGAGALVAGGWLPGPLVEEVSRAVVRLLDLETTGHGPHPSGPPAQDRAVAYLPEQTGPVPFSSASVGGPPLGSFGPPVEPATPPPVSPPVPPPLEPPTPPPTTPPVTVPPATTPPATAPPLTAPRRPVRRVSCTVSLVVAGALAAVTVGGTLLLDQMRGDTSGGDSAAGRPSGTTPATRDPSSGAPSGRTSPAPVAEVPASFVGTWSGPVTERSGLPHGTVTAEFAKGAKGDDIVRTTSRITVLGTTVECFGVGKLVSATADVVRVEERTDESKRSTESLCTTGGVAELTFTRTSGTTLRYESAEDAAGTPKGTLTKE